MRKFAMMVTIAGGLLIAAGPARRAECRASRSTRGMTQVEKRLNTVERVVSRTEWRRAAGAARDRPARRPADQRRRHPGQRAARRPARRVIASVEGEVSGLTNRVETAEHRLQQLEADFAAYKKDTDARLKALEDRPRRPPSAPGRAVNDGPAPDRSSRTKPVATAQAERRPARRRSRPRRSRRRGAQADRRRRPRQGRRTPIITAIACGRHSSIPRPRRSSKNTTRSFPKHRLVSRAQNVLGLIYLDDNRPKDAAQIFYENYSKLPDGDRAARQPAQPRQVADRDEASARPTSARSIRSSATSMATN